MTLVDFTFRSLIFSSNVCVKILTLRSNFDDWLTLNRSLSRTSLGPLRINDENLYEDKNSTDMKDIYFKGFFKTAAFSHL